MIRLRKVSKHNVWCIKAERERERVLLTCLSHPNRERARLVNLKWSFQTQVLNDSIKKSFQIQCLMHRGRERESLVNLLVFQTQCLSHPNREGARLVNLKWSFQTVLKVLNDSIKKSFQTPCLMHRGRERESFRSRVYYPLNY